MIPFEPVRKYQYRLLFAPSAWKEWQLLDGAVKEPLRQILRIRLENPHVPGGALHGELAGHYKIKLKKLGFRLVYGVEDGALIVMAVDMRDDPVVYRSAVARLVENVSALAQAVKAWPDN